MKSGHFSSLLTIALTILLQFGPTACLQNNASLDSKALLQAKLNDTVSKVIEAMADNSLQADTVAVADQSSQEHAKKGRIFARKGVEIITTTTSAPVSTLTKSTIVSDAHPASNNTTTGSSVQVANSDGSHKPTTPDLKSNSSTSSNKTVASDNATSSVEPGVLKPPTMSNTSSPSTATLTTASSTTSSSTTTTSTSTTTTTTTTTTTPIPTTTTTKAPKKPKITYSVDDEPKLIQAAKPGYNSVSVSDVNGRLHVEEPLVELSKEYIPALAGGASGGGDAGRSHREYIVPVVTLIFAIPLLMGLFLLSYRRAKEFWLTRHYRRMDFLVDGMYNY